jgi:hypothetical protein
MLLGGPGDDESINRNKMRRQAQTAKFCERGDFVDNRQH